MNAKIENLENKLLKAESKLQTLNTKKNDVVRKQFELEDQDKCHTSSYEKLIEKDFDLADKIEDQERIIKNLKQQISRAKRAA